MNSARLERVAVHLHHNVERKDFQLSTNKNCAIGHASRLPYFKQIGLKYDEANDQFVFKGVTQHRGLANCFGLSVEQVEYLFCGNALLSIHKTRTPTPKQVAKAIRKFIKDNDKADR